MGSSGSVTPGFILSGFSWLIGWSSFLRSDMLCVGGALMNNSEAEGLCEWEVYGESSFL